MQYLITKSFEEYCCESEWVPALSGAHLGGGWGPPLVLPCKNFDPRETLKIQNQIQHLRDYTLYINLKSLKIDFNTLNQKINLK